MTSIFRKDRVKSHVNCGSFSPTVLLMDSITPDGNGLRLETGQCWSQNIRVAHMNYFEKL